MRRRPLVAAEREQRERRRANAIAALQDLLEGREELAAKAAAAKVALRELDATIASHRVCVCECTEHLELGAPDDGQAVLPGVEPRAGRGSRGAP